jgi:hypothetical protein
MFYTPMMEPDEQVRAGWISLASILTIVMRNLINLLLLELNKLRLRLTWLFLKAYFMLIPVFNELKFRYKLQGDM